MIGIAHLTWPKIAQVIDVRIERIAPGCNPVVLICHRREVVHRTSSAFREGYCRDKPKSIR
jgi:hypothetical protein